MPILFFLSDCRYWGVGSFVTATQPDVKDVASICSGVSSNSSCKDPHATCVVGKAFNESSNHT